MSQPARLTTAKYALLAAAALSLAAASTARAQPRPAAPAQAARGAGANTARPGIDSLDPGEKKLMSELARRGLDDLLGYSFQKNGVPEEAQKEFRVFAALGDLSNPNFLRQPATEQQKKIQAIVDGINKVLPTMNDPELLLKYAAQLVINGTVRLVNLLEYWGENPKTQATLNPVAETVDTIFKKAMAESKKRADEALSSVKTSDDPKLKVWERADQLEKIARYNWANASYGLALSYDHANPKRKEACKAAIEGIKEFTEEGSTVRVPALETIAKLTMASGDYAGASKLFDAISKLPQTDDPKYPNKYVATQYEARYFRAACHLLARQPKEAEDALKELYDWTSAHLAAMAQASGSKEADVQKSTEAASTMLEYRIAGMKAEVTKDPKFNAQAISILMDLVGRRPDLRGIIFEQVMARLPEKPVMKELDPLLLEALMTRGMQAALRKEPEKDDPKHIDLATDAAREIVARKGKPGVSDSQVDNAALYVGVLEESLAKQAGVSAAVVTESKQDAGEAYLNYYEQFGPTHKERGSAALDNALQVIVFDLRKPDSAARGDTRTVQLYDRVLKDATAAGKNEYAYMYAMRLKELSQFKEAAAQFAKVPPNPKAPLAALMAKYYQMFCLEQRLTKEPNLADVEKKQLDAQVQTLADQVNGMVAQQLAGATGDARTRLERVGAQTTLMAADLARASKDAQRTEKVLAGFETKIANLPDREDFLSEALFLRTNALFVLGKNAEGVDTLRQYVSQHTGAAAVKLIGQFLYKLNEEYLAAKGKHDEPTMAQLVGQRAALSGLLMEQVKADPKNPNRKEYAIFDAKAQRDAVPLEKDPAKKAQYLAAALKTLQTLQADSPKDSPEYANLDREIALTDFDLGNYKECHEKLRALFSANKFGTPLLRVVNADGSEESRPNNVFWEGLHRLLKSAVELSKAEKNPEKQTWATGVLKDFVIEWGDQLGGTGWKDEFKDLRQELIPNWAPPSITAGQPASRPTAAAK